MTDGNMTNEQSLLIAMSNRPASLSLVRAVGDQLEDPKHTKITLMHYLMPVYWEHGGDLSNDQELQEILDEEQEVLNIEERQERRSRNYFEEATAILIQAGVPSDNICTRLTSDGVDVAHAVLDEVQNGDYSTVVVGEHDCGMLEQLLHRSLASFLKSHTKEIRIWQMAQP